jgi:hypothetical protein
MPVSLAALLRAKYPREEDEKHDSRIPARTAGYVELSGAKKDADCELVKVKGGVSSQLGCCNKFRRKDKSVQEFKCGTCKELMPL